MAKIAIPVTKSKGSVEFDTDLLPEAVYRQALAEGLKVLVNGGMSKITKEQYPDQEELKAAAQAKAESNAQDLRDGKLKAKRGAATAGKIAGATMTEARRIARNLVKDAIKANNGKISHYSAAEITTAANAMIEGDPSIITQAEAALKARETSKPVIDVMALIKPDAKLVAKAEKEKAERKAEKGLSAKQAGRPAIRTKPPTQVSV